MRIAHITTAALSTVAIALSGVVTPVSAAPADPTGAWSNVQQVSGQEMFGAFGVAPDGYAVAETMSHLPMGCDGRCDPDSFVDLAERQPGGTWTDLRLPGGGTAYAVEFDTASNGWALSYRSDRSVVVSSRPAGGSWAPAEVVPWPTDVPDNATVQLLLTGTGAPYVWFVTGDGTVLHLATRTSSGWTTSSRTVDTYPQLTAAPDGAVRAAWVRATGDGRNAIVVSDLRPDGAWGPDTTVAQTSEPVGQIEWAGPRALALRTVPYSGDLSVLGQSTGGSWARDVTDLGAARSVVTSSGAGRTVVAWNAGDAVRVTELRADGTWSRRAEPTTSGTVDAIQVDARGNATLVWAAMSDPSTLRYTRRAVGAGAWTKSRPLPSEVGAPDWNGGVAIGVDARGAVTVGAAPSPGTRWSLSTADLSTPVAVTTIDRAPARGWGATSSFPIGWKTTWTEADTHDVRYLVRPITGGPWKRHRLASGTTADHKALRGKPGRVYCLSARAHSATTTGPWGEATCVATPLDDRALKAGPGWKRAGGTSVARMRGATLTSPRISGSRFALLVRPSSGAGTVQVSLGGHRLGTYRLAQGEPGQRRVIALGGFKHAHHGKLQIKVVSSGKPVRIDGIYAR